MAGIPASWSAGSLMTLAFLWWNRVCEYSADRAGLLACGKPEKAVSALVKLAAGPAAHNLRDLQKAYQKIDSEDDTWLGSLGETLQTHPMLIRRIDELRGYAASSQYQRLLAQVIQNERMV
jgi:Zn-dependent protease with chaperone function